MTRRSSHFMSFFNFFVNRKRSREDDVLCDSTPLSKRINNLHLSNFEEATAQYNQHQLPHNHNNNNNHLPTNLHATIASKSVNGISDVDNNMYDPELNESENPFYYGKNKLLHDLHLERLKRCTV